MSLSFSIESVNFMDPWKYSFHAGTSQPWIVDFWILAFIFLIPIPWNCSYRIEWQRVKKILIWCTCLVFNKTVFLIYSVYSVHLLILGKNKIIAIFWRTSHIWLPKFCVQTRPPIWMFLLSFDSFEENIIISLYSLKLLTFACVTNESVLLGDAFSWSLLVIKKSRYHIWPIWETFRDLRLNDFPVLEQ